MRTEAESLLNVKSCVHVWAATCSTRVCSLFGIVSLSPSVACRLQPTEIVLFFTKEPEKKEYSSTSFHLARKSKSG